MRSLHLPLSDAVRFDPVDINLCGATIYTVLQLQSYIWNRECVPSVFS